MRVADRVEQAVGHPKQQSAAGVVTEATGLWAVVGQPAGTDHQGLPTPPTGLWYQLSSMRTDMLRFQEETRLALANLTAQVSTFVESAKQSSERRKGIKGWFSRRLEHLADWLIPLLIGAGALELWRHFH